MVSATKEPWRVRAGQIGARRRWGEPRVVRLDDLTNDQRAVVRALIELCRSPRTKEAAPVTETPGAAESEGHGNDRPTD